MKKSPVSPGALSGLIERVPGGVVGLGAGAVVLVLLVVLALSMGGGGGGTSQEAVVAAYEGLANELADGIAARLDPYEAALDRLAADAEVRAALQAGELATLEALAAARTPDLAHVLRLRVLPASTRDPDTAASPPLSFASISMIRSARDSGEDPPAEVHLANNDNEHLVIIRRVTDAGGDRLLGFLHLSLDPDVVREALTAQAAPNAFAEIRQGPSVSIASSGVTPGAEAARVAVNVDGTRLAVVFSAPGLAAGEAGGAGALGPLTLGALALVVLLGIAVVFLRRGPGVRVGTPSSDTVIFQGAIKAILDGAHPGLEQLLPGYAGAGGMDLDAIAERAEGDDVTQIKMPGKGEDPTLPREPDGAGIEVVEEAAEAGAEVPASIFREYDIRGIVGETLTEEGVYQIGRALGAEAAARGQGTVVVARDGRHSSEALTEALTRGLTESGRDVLDIGLTPTPVLYFATNYLDARSGVMVTGSHNPAQYNGLKIVLDGETLSGEAIQAVRRRVVEQDFVDGQGSVQSTEIVPDYIRRISEEIPVTLGNALKVVVDCGNGVPGIVAPAILRAIGHDVIELFCEVDGDFPNHHPDPSQPENLQALIDAVADEGADLGLAFDGDGDRLGVVDSEGNIIWPDKQMILFARDILSRNPGAKIIYDVKCSRLLAREIEAHGGEAIMSRTGHSLIKSAMQETGALLAGEMSGHIFFKERWYGFDDALYSAARLCEILVNAKASAAEVFGALPGGVTTPELRLDMPETRHAEFMAEVLAAAKFDDGEVSTIDGLRVDFTDSWGLVRASNTTPCLVLRFEGDDEAALERVKQRFRELLGAVDASLDLPF